MSEQAEKEPVVGFVHSPIIFELLRRYNLSLLVSTYQAQRILLFTAGPERLSMLMRTFERPTGMSYNGNQLVLCTKKQLWFFEKTFGVRDSEGTVLPHDVIFVPRRSYVTGDVSAHEVGWVNGRLIFMNTRFSCLATTSEEFSFEPIWKPPFISKIVAEDRCHLNGMAIDSAGVNFVTALGKSDTQEGWRANKKDGGILMHVPTGEIVAHGFCMPHSPRIYARKLWILDSGVGQMQVVDPKSGVRETVCRFPGYGRGLTFYDRFAFVGLSKIRESNMFGGLPISEHISELKCAVCVVDLQSGQIVGFIEFTKGIEELFDIVVIPNYTSPHIIGFEEETVDGMYVLPPDYSV